MGSAIWVNYGIGVCTTDLKIKSTKSVAKLISLAPDFNEYVKQVFADCDISKPILEDYLELDEDYQNGIAYILQEVINELTEINVTACDDINGKRYLLYQPLYPWQMTNLEKGLDKQTVEDILTRYISVITNTEFAIDEISAENCG